MSSCGIASWADSVLTATLRHTIPLAGDGILSVAAQPTEDLDSASQQLGEPISSYRSGTMLCGEDTLGLMVSCYVETPRYGLIEVTGFQGSVSVDEVSRFTDALADAVA